MVEPTASQARPSPASFLASVTERHAPNAMPQPRARAQPLRELRMVAVVRDKKETVQSLRSCV
jgi:hypothetical protein